MLAAGWTLEAGRRARFRGDLAILADQAALRIEAFLDGRLDVVYRLRDDWRTVEMDQAVFEERSLAMQVRYPGFQALNWVDQDHRVRWITPRAGNELALGFDLDDHPLASPLVKRAEFEDRLVLSEPLTLLQGGWGFVGYLRIGDAPEAPTGLLNVDFRARSLLEAAFEKGLPDRMGIAIDDEGTRVAWLGAPRESVVPEYMEERRIPVANRSWRVQLSPSRKRVAAMTGPADRLPVVLGFILSVGIAALIAVGQWRQVMLRQSEQKYRSIVDVMNEGIWILDAEGYTRFVNRSLAGMLGYAPKQMTGRPFDAFVDTWQRDVVKERLQPSTSDRRPVFELDLVKQDGTLVQTVISVKPFLDEAGRFIGAQAVVTDVTERKQLEAQLHHSQKMEAVGRLAGGIAHDFNNIVTGIMGACHLLEHELQTRPELIELVDEINTCGERAAGLTHQLLAFSRQQVLRPKVLNPARALEESNSLLRRLIGEDLDLKVEVDDDLAFVSIDPTQLQQVFLNLVVNARDAMPRGGVIWMRGRNVDAEEATQVGLPSETHVALSVEDTGAGIPPEVLDRIFEPFFTTKEFGKGTGLGLATVLGIVEQSGGRVTVDSRVGVGSMFTVLLPAVPGAAGEAVTPARPRGALGPKEETILLVEDEDSVRKMAQRGLQTAGYLVHAESRPTDALEWAKQPDTRIDLLITDVVMPQMSGLVLAEALKRERPDLPVIYMSGYADEERLPQALRREVFSSEAIFDRPAHRRGSEQARRRARQGPAQLVVMGTEASSAISRRSTWAGPGTTMVTSRVSTTVTPSATTSIHARNATG